MKRYWIFGIVALSLLSSCGTEETASATSAIRPPLEGIDIPMRDFTFDASRGSTIRTPSGTQITVPAEALTDEKGQPVRGKVKLQFREFHTPAEILVSGIPMRYDSAGTKYDFISAGMFEIAAEQNGQKLKIREGKAINVELASYKEDEGYSFYQLDPKTGDWKNEGIALSRKNERKLSEMQQFKDENLVVFDIDYSTRPELERFHNICWTYTGADPEKDPLHNDWILQERWRDITVSPLGKGGEYRITLSNRQQRIELEMAPYFTEDQREQEKAFASQVTDYEQLVADRKNAEEAIQLQADLTRSFAVSEFGFYNWDKIEKIVKEEQLAVVNATFTLDGESLPTTARLYHVDGKDKLLARDGNTWDKLVFRPQDNNRLLVVLPDNRVAIADSKDFDRVKDKPEATFALERVQKKVTSMEDVRRLLE
ncbi:MAG TPA: hypothetical protein VK151_16390 [Fluviicola sp.]|nr:hypothetical protein [Fluviicola sp.]